MTILSHFKCKKKTLKIRPLLQTNQKRLTNQNLKHFIKKCNKIASKEKKTFNPQIILKTRFLQKIWEQPLIHTKTVKISADSNQNLKI